MQILIKVCHFQERLDEIMIPRVTVPAGRKPHIVQYLINKKLVAIVQQRYSMFERVYSVTVNMANKLLDSGYKLLSRFGRWCPVAVCSSFGALLLQLCCRLLLIYRQGLCYCYIKCQYTKV